MSDDNSTLQILFLILIIVLLSLCYPSERQKVETARTYWTEALGGSHGE